MSVATVSRVLNDVGPVKEGTRRRVHEVAGKLRYVPNGAARSLITRKTSTLGVLLPELYGEFFSEVIRGIDQLARQSGYHLLVSSSHDDKSEVEAALRAMRGRVDGLLVMSPAIKEKSLVANLPDSLPVVVLNSAIGSVFDSLTMDNFGGARAMVRHLMKAGHKRVAIIKGPERNYDAAERLRGYRAALRSARIDRDRRYEAEGDFTETSGFRATLALINRLPRPTAIFAANDSMAIGALSALHQAGVSVPREMAIAGFDDVPMAQYTNPPLSSVHVGLNELGERATETLLRVVREKARHVRRHDVLGTTLVIRESCGGLYPDRELVQI
ncbi:MAG: LacI family DNA-binding transcriptional regulator [Gemmatimonadaceae bacterium]